MVKNCLKLKLLGLNPQVLTEYILEERIINNYEIYQSRKKVFKNFFFTEQDVVLKPPKTFN